ncbi:hypothetical protein Tco_0116559 [Tanacetum coccineum]
MCADSWGRISFARAPIEVCADSSLKKEVVMAIEKEEVVPKTTPKAPTTSSAVDGFDEIEKFFKCRVEMGRGLAQRPVIMGVSHDLRGDSWGCVPRSLFWREYLDGDGELRFDCLTFALVSSKAHREGCRASRGEFPYCLRGSLANNDLRSLWATRMDFKNFIYTEDDDDLAFLCKEPSLRFSIGSFSASVNTELPKDIEEPKVQPAVNTVDLGESLKADVLIVHPRSVAAHIKERKCKTRGGSSRPPMKRKLAFESSSSRAVCAKTSALKGRCSYSFHI